jgi:hypothetical protein
MEPSPSVARRRHRHAAIVHDFAFDPRTAITGNLHRILNLSVPGEETKITLVTVMVHNPSRRSYLLAGSSQAGGKL